MNIRKMVVAGAVLATMTAGVSYASIPSADGTVHGCVNPTNSALRVIDADTGATCPAGWPALTLNQQGPAGAPGVGGLQEIGRVGTLNSSSPKTMAIQCPSGKQPVGGGGAPRTPGGAIDGNIAIVATTPAIGGWFIEAREIVTTNASWSLTGSVLCATTG